MKLYLRTLIFGGLLWCGSQFFTHPVFAENDQGGVTVSPAFQDVTLRPGDTQGDFSVALTNETDIPITLHVGAYDFGSLDESGGVAFLGASHDLTKKYTLAQWMHPEKEVVMVVPHETAHLKVAIENRETLAPGGHYGALVFRVESDSSGDTSANDVAVEQMFSTLVFVKKIGGEVYHLTYDGREYVSHLFLFQNHLDVRFRNEGNVHVVPRGIALLKDPLGRTVAKGIINEESALILPETLRRFPVQLQKLGLVFIPGRYTLEVAYRYDGKEDFVTETSSFDFIPPTATVGVLVFLATCGWYVAKRRRKSGEKKALSRRNEVQPPGV